MKLIAILDADAASFSLRDETGGNANFETPWHRAVLRLEDESGETLRSVEVFVDGRLDVRGEGEPLHPEVPGVEKVMWTGEELRAMSPEKFEAVNRLRERFNMAAYKREDFEKFDRLPVPTEPSDPEPSDGEAEAPQAEVAADVHADEPAPVDDAAGDADVDGAAAGDGEAHAEDAAGVDGGDVNPAVAQAPDMPSSAVAEADLVEQPALPAEKPSETPLAAVGNVPAPDTEQGEAGEQMAGQGFAAFIRHAEAGK